MLGTHGPIFVRVGSALKGEGECFAVRTFSWVLSRSRELVVIVLGLQFPADFYAVELWLQLELCFLTSRAWCLGVCNFANLCLSSNGTAVSSDSSLPDPDILRVSAFMGKPLLRFSSSGEPWRAACHLRKQRKASKASAASITRNPKRWRPPERCD